MKRFISVLICAILLFTCCAFPASAVNDEEDVSCVNATERAEIKATGLILSYGLEVYITGTSLKIRGETYCDDSVVKSGFKNLVVQRKKVTDSSWSDYYDYGDIYIDSYYASLSRTLTVASGYQYRVTCKHYAKKNILLTQNISNTSNVVYVS